MPLQPYLDALSEGDVAAAAVVLFALLIAHALCDHPLQGEFVALRKNRHYRPEGDAAPRIWPYCMSAHALIHAGGVWIVLGHPGFAATEFALHWLIDALKAEGKTSIHVDQLLHLLTKIGYVAAFATLS